MENVIPHFGGLPVEFSLRAGAFGMMAAASFVLGTLGTYRPAVAAQASNPQATEAVPTPVAPAASPGDPQKGAGRAEALYCGVCHGPKGRSETPEWPSLAGQGEGYLAKQLALLRGGERVSLEMGPIAKTLTDEDIADLSAYYAAQSLPSSPSPAPDGSTIATLYQKGDAARALQACADCHGLTGSGDARMLAPALRTQQPTYLRSQLEAYGRRSRYKSAAPSGLDPAGLQAMYDAGSRLTADEMQQLALYLRGLD